MLILFFDLISIQMAVEGVHFIVVVLRSQRTKGKNILLSWYTFRFIPDNTTETVNLHEDDVNCIKIKRFITGKIAKMSRSFNY